jgi:hypothetical protein
VFAKLFQSMYDGSLATHGPWEALVTFQQFLVLADRFGDVDITAEVISRRTIIPLGIIEKGIAELSKPDPYSRDKREEGRRIVPITPERAWGWHIVNYSKYSAIRNAEERREYKALYYLEKVAPKLQQQKKKPLPVGFGAFWSAYPRKVGKGAAEKAWLKISPDSSLLVQILKSVGEQCDSEQWLRDGGKFIPHPTTWLNRKGWLDETTQIDYGTCKFCPNPATALSKSGVPHCAVPRHIDQANGR